MSKVKFQVSKRIFLKSKGKTWIRNGKDKACARGAAGRMEIGFEEAEEKVWEMNRGMSLLGGNNERT